MKMVALIMIATTSAIIKMMMAGKMVTAFKIIINIVMFAVLVINITT